MIDHMSSVGQDHSERDDKFYRLLTLRDRKELLSKRIEVLQRLRDRREKKKAKSNLKSNFGAKRGSLLLDGQVVAQKVFFTTSLFLYLLFHKDPDTVAFLVMKVSMLYS